MKLKRFWADDIEVADYWTEPQQLAKHRVYMCFYDPDYIKSDENGFRIPLSFNSLNEKYLKSQEKKKIFCFGGSTTFGSYCKYHESYPNHLESFSNDNFSVFNFGLPGADIKSSFYTLLYCIRLGMIPDKVIFLDGINEKQAWFQATYDYEKYEELDYQYHPFLRLVEKAHKYDSFSNYINSFRKNIIVQKTDIENIDYLRFVADQSLSYIKSKDVIEKVANQWNFNTMFFLQPTVFDFIQDQLNSETRLRYEYLKALYRSIINKSKNIVYDISKNINLEPEMYIDWQHCNGEGNYIIAKKILEYL